MICNAVMFLAQYGLWGGCFLEHCLFVIEYVSSSLKWHSKHAQLVSQLNYQLDYEFERCELGSKS